VKLKATKPERRWVRGAILGAAGHRLASAAFVLAILAALGLLFALATSAVAAPEPSAVLTALGARIEMVRIPPGHFRMGTDSTITGPQGWSNDGEGPAHDVTLTHSFWIGRYPITQRQWLAVMGVNPSHNLKSGLDAPVEQVSWGDCRAFITKLNQTQGLWIARLPSEAEWEYACRAGTSGERYGPIDQIAWYAGNSEGHSEPVGKKLPNAFGLYDMLGNVWQWCGDWFAAYSDSALVDPQGPASGEKRIMRGGCYYCDQVHARASRRNRDPEAHLYRSIGLRIAAEPRHLAGVADSAAVR